MAVSVYWNFIVQLCRSRRHSSLLAETIGKLSQCRHRSVPLRKWMYRRVWRRHGRNSALT